MGPGARIELAPHPYQGCSLPLKYPGATLVLGAGFEPAAILLCKRSGFDHSHHPSELEQAGGFEPPIKPSEGFVISVSPRLQNFGQPARTRTENHALGEHRDLQFHHGLMEQPARIELASSV